MILTQQKSATLTVAASEPDRPADKFSNYLDYRYGTCKKCFNPIQQPGLDHFFCFGCRDWTAVHYVLKPQQHSEIAKAASQNTASETERAHPATTATKKPKSAKRTVQPKNLAQLNLLGGVQ